MLDNANSEVNFSVGEGLYMVPNDMNLKIGNIASYNNKILISKPGYTVGVNNVNKIIKIKTISHTNTKTKPTTHSNNKLVVKKQSSNIRSNVITH